MGSTLRTFLARAEIMFVLLAMIVFVCWQQHRIAQREEQALRQAVEAARQEEARWEADLDAKVAEQQRDRIAPPPREVR